MNSIISVLTAVFDVALVYFLFSSVLERKNKKWVLIFCACILYSGVIFVSQLIRLEGQVKLAINTILILILSSFCFSGSFLSRMLTSTLFYCIYLVGDFFGHGVNALLSKSSYSTGAIALYSYLCLFCLVYWKIPCNFTDPIDNKSRLTLLAGAILCATVMAIFISTIRNIFGMYALPPYIYIALGMFFLLFNILIIIMSKSLAKGREAQKSMLIYETQLQHYVNHYNSLAAMYSEMREIRHNQKFHYAIIYQYVAMAELDKAKAYIETLNESIPQKAEYGKSGNVSIDVMIHNFIYNADRCNIKTDIMVRVSMIMLDPIDLCVMLGNALENAVDACKLVKEPSLACIRVRLTQNQNMLFFEVINPIEWEIDTTTRRPMTTKKDKKIHGYGLQSIERIVAKYDGHMICKQEANSFVLQCIVENVVGEYSFTSGSNHKIPMKKPNNPFI